MSAARGERLGLRSSIAARAGVAGCAQVDTALLLERIAEEVAGIEARLEPIYCERVTESARRRPVLRVRRDAFRAGARLIDGPIIEFDVGAALAFDDLALFSLCDEVFLARDPEQVRALARGPAPRTRKRAAGPGAVRRFCDYSALMLHPQIDRRILSLEIPAAQWRLLQASMLGELMIAFTLLHERGHFTLAHWAALGGGLAISDGDAPADSAEMEGALSDAQRRVIELQADAQAFFVLHAYAMAEDGPCARYCKALPDTPEDALCEIGHDQALRLCLTAASLACVAFHLAANPNPAKRNPKYPSPHARLMNLMVNTPVLSPSIRGEESQFRLRKTDLESGGPRAAAFKGLVEDVLAMALSDLRTVTQHLGEELSPVAVDGSAVADWVSDFNAFWISDDETLNAPARTEPGQELERLRPIEAAFIGRLRVLQQEAFGAQTLVFIDSFEDD